MSRHRFRRARPFFVTRHRSMGIMKRKTWQKRLRDAPSFLPPAFYRADSDRTKDILPSRSWGEVSRGDSCPLMPRKRSLCSVLFPISSSDPLEYSLPLNSDWIRGPSCAPVSSKGSSSNPPPSFNKTCQGWMEEPSSTFLWHVVGVCPLRQGIVAAD